MTLFHFSTNFTTPPDLTSIFERGDYLFIYLGKGPNVPEEQVEILGSLTFQLLLQSTYARGTGARDRYLLAMDEYHHLVTLPGLAKRFETALTSARSFGLSLLLVSHNFAQLPATLREIVLGNCDLIALFRTSGRNASYFGDFLPEVDLELLARRYSRGPRTEPTASEIRRHQTAMLQQLPSREFFWWDRRKPYRATLIRVPDLESPHKFAGVSERALEEIIRNEGWDRGAAALPRETLRAQIESRKMRLHNLLHPPVVLDQREREVTAKPSKRKAPPKIG